MKRRKLIIHTMAAAMVLSSVSAGSLAFAEESQNVTESEAVEATATEAATPDMTAPAALPAETQMPETTAPAADTQAPETTAPVADTQAPETVAPADTQAPETTAPSEDTTASETAAPETQAAETAKPGTEASETQTSETAELETRASEMQASESEMTEETSSEAQTEAPEQEATEEQTEVQTEALPGETMVEPETEEAEEVFTAGYAYVKPASVIYRNRWVAADIELGRFTEKTVVYAAERFVDADDNDANDWLRVVFAVKEEETVSVMEGYIQAVQLLPMDETEAAALTVQMGQNPEHVCYQNRADLPLTPAAFEEKKTEETSESESDTEEASETETEPAVAAVQYMITADWAKEKLEVGDEITLTAVCEPEDTVLWQSSMDGTEWTTIAENASYTYVLTEENCKQLIRAVSADEE